MKIEELITKIAQKGFLVEVIIEDGKMAYSVGGFYRCRRITLIETSQGIWRAHQRNNEITPIFSWEDFVSMNAKWWRRSKGQDEKWSYPEHNMMEEFYKYELVFRKGFDDQF